MTDPVVTVCVVAWNAAEDLGNLLPSLEAASAGLPLQTVVVDNGSTDDTEAVLARHPEVEVIRNTDNPGITPARNQALAVVRGSVVLMLDADTIPRPGSIRLLVDYLDAHPEVGLVGPKLLDPDGTLQLSCRTFPPALLPFMRRPPLASIFEHRRRVNRHLLRHDPHLEARPVDWVMGAAQCYRASLLPLLGGYDERIFSHGGEDTDWCLRVWKAGSEVHYVPQAEIVHVYGHFTRRNPLSKQALRGFTDYYYMLFKHRDARRGFAAP